MDYKERQTITCTKHAFPYIEMVACPSMLEDVIDYNNDDRSHVTIRDDGHGEIWYHTHYIVWPIGTQDGSRAV